MVTSGCLGAEELTKSGLCIASWPAPKLCSWHADLLWAKRAQLSRNAAINNLVGLSTTGGMLSKLFEVTYQSLRLKHPPPAPCKVAMPLVCGQPFALSLTRARCLQRSEAVKTQGRMHSATYTAPLHGKGRVLARFAPIRSYDVVLPSCPAYIQDGPSRAAESSPGAWR